MDFERSPETREALSVAKKRALILELFTKNWSKKRGFPFMPDLVGPDGKSLEKSTGAAPGGATTEKVSEADHVIKWIRTGTGYIAEGKPEMITKELTGCMGLFVFGESKKGEPISALFHMTPTKGLAWGNFKSEDDEKRWGHEMRIRMSQAIVEALVEVGAELSRCQATFIRTAGFPPDLERYNGYSEDHLKEKTDDLIASFTTLGLTSRAIEPLAMETATVYWSPEAPNDIFAVGEKRIPNSSGGVDEPAVGEEEVISQLISLE